MVLVEFSSGLRHNRACVSLHEHGYLVVCRPTSIQILVFVHEYSLTDRWTVGKRRRVECGWHLKALVKVCQLKIRRISDVDIQAATRLIAKGHRSVIHIAEGKLCNVKMVV